MLIWPTNSVQVWQTRALLNSGQTASSLLLSQCVILSSSLFPSCCLISTNMEMVVFKKLILGDFERKISCKNKFWITTYSWPRLKWVSTSCALFCAILGFKFEVGKTLATSLNARRWPKCVQKPKLICWKTGCAGPLNWFFDLLYGFIILAFLVEIQENRL